MKIRNILYISAIILLAGCSKDADVSNSTLSGNGEKTPLRINATLNTDRAGTRAEGNTFAVNDQLKVYIRHTTGAADAGVYPTIAAGQAPSLVSINVTSAGTSPSLSPIYWDDFSNSTGASTDLRTSGHGLQSYYSYCYNGGTPSTLDESTSVLGWTVQQNQSTAEAVQHSDILWSPEQTPVPYSHSTAYDSGHGDFRIPYKHAMSEVTVTVTAAAGFDGSTNPLSSTVLTLNAMNTVTELNALSQSFSPLKQETAENIKSVTMRAEAYTSGTLTRNYTAIVAPGTILKEDVKLLDIKKAHGNDYTVTITAAMLSSTNTTDWGYGLSEDDQIGTDDGGKHYIVTQPGVNYHLNVTINKSSVQTHATLADWKAVNASGTGDIVLDEDDTTLIMDDGDVTGITGVEIVGVDKNIFKNGASFSLFRVHTKHNSTDSNTQNDDITPLSSSTRPNDTSGNFPGYEFATISTFTNDATEADDDKWTNEPIIYWPNITQKYYFRALAKYHDNESGLNISSVGSITPPLDKGTAVSQGTISDGVATGDDILWGTTPQHKGTSTNKVYKRGWAIPPRKGGVPIAFEHALSKISITLETTDDAEVLETNAKVNLTDATIAISNIYTNATITIDNGDMDFTGKSKVENAISATATTFENLNLLVIPQTFGDNALVTITLPNENNAVYSIPLKDCVVSGGSTPITAWERGKNYSYTIHIEKEKVQFHALVKDWDVVNGSGNAALEW